MKVITKSGRLLVIRTPDVAEEAEKLNAVSFIQNLRKSWYICQEKGIKRGISEEDIGRIFFETLRDLFGNYDDIVIEE